jgi:hypothetical protein
MVCVLPGVMGRRPDNLIISQKLAGGGEVMHYFCQNTRSNIVKTQDDDISYTIELGVMV